MDVGAARSVLGVAAGASAGEVRAAYRARLRATHPDAGGTAADVAAVVEAYRVLRDLPRESAVAAAGPPGAPATVMVDGDTIVADLPSGDLFALLVEAADAVGEVAYVDAAAGLLEVVAEVDGRACSVVWTLQGRATGLTEAWCTVEPLGGGPPPPVEAVAALLAGGLRSVADR